jgi:hypothetical protein
LVYTSSLEMQTSDGVYTGLSWLAGGEKQSTFEQVVISRANFFLQFFSAEAQTTLVVLDFAVYYVNKTN